jgi:hypothetical protein
MHRAGGRFSAWTFVQALRTNSPRPAPMAELPCPAPGDRRGAGVHPQDRALAIRLLVLRRLVGAQPERDVSRLHHLPFHARKVVVQRLPVPSRREESAINRAKSKGDCAERARTCSTPLAGNMATESAASAHASHAARVPIAPTPVLRSFAPSVTTPLYGRPSPRRYRNGYEGIGS